MDHSKIEIRGRSLFDCPVTLQKKILAHALNGTVILIISLQIFHWLKMTPFLHWTSFGTVLLISALVYSPKAFLKRSTLGETLFHMKWNDRTQKLSCQALPNPKDLLFTASSSCLILFSLVYSIQAVILSHPIWATPGSLELSAFIPSEDNWVVSPFFYTIGGWPKKFQQSPIFYSIPYEMGPPSKFIGKITTTWNNPDIKLTLEGPKTPRVSPSRDELKKCFEPRMQKPSCLHAKLIVLERHLGEMRSYLDQKCTLTQNFFDATEWNMQWVHVSDSHIEAARQPQGVHIRATRGAFVQDRFVLVNPKGVQQTLILSRPNTEQGVEAYNLVEKVIESSHVFTELESGRAWINSELNRIELNQMDQISDREEVAQHLQKIQMLLISKISVDPGSFDSYFHLAGTSLMLTNKSIRKQDGKNVAALENIRSAYRFAQDLAPDDPRTLQIQNYWLESRKY